MDTNVKKSSFVRRRPKTTIVIALLTISFLYIVLCGITVLRILSFRKHPQKSVAASYFAGNLPHNILARALMFKRGASYYNSDLMAWANDSKLISDNLWNRWILEKHFDSVPASERADLLPNYPLTPTAHLLPFLKTALEQNRYLVLPVLGRSNAEECRQIYRQWVEERIVKPRDKKLFVAAAGALAQSTAYSFPELLNKFWEQLTPAQRDRVVLKMAAHLSPNAQGGNDAFDWANSSINRGTLRMSCSAVALNGRFLSIPLTKQKALDQIAQHASSITNSHVDLLFKFTKQPEQLALATALLERFKNKNDAGVLEVIHHVAHEDIGGAEQLASYLISGQDSELRKGAIVLLVRHGSIKAKGMIDETFKGGVPRKTMYLSSDDYTKGSAAADLYSKLATHDYKQTGKTWPPTYVTGGPSVEEAQRWASFLQTYPWFPGTDDAYYRLAFSQFAQKNYYGCLTTIKEYLKRDYWPDNDAKPYMMYLLRQLAVSTNVSDEEVPSLPHIRNIASSPLALKIIGASQVGDAAIQSIDWFLSNPNQIQFLNTDERMLKMMREAALMFNTSPADSVCHLLAGKFDTGTDYTHLNDSPSSTPDVYDEEEPEPDENTDTLGYQCSADEFQEELPVYQASTLQSILYGIFSTFPAPAPNALRISVPSDPGDEAVGNTAAFLNDRLSGASLVGLGDRSLDEPIVLALLHSGPEFARWEHELNPVMELLVSISNRDIPTVVSDRHLRLVDDRKK